MLLAEISTFSMHLHAKKVVLYQLGITKIRYIMISFLFETCENVKLKPTLQQLTENSFTQKLQTHQKKSNFGMPGRLHFFILAFLTQTLADAAILKSKNVTR